MTEYVIVANGPPVSLRLLRVALAGKISIALDGAADTFLSAGLRPDIILGDFDSLSAKARVHFAVDAQKFNASSFRKGAVTIFPAYDQNLTDLEKALDYCFSQSVTKIDIVAANGGRADHHEAMKLALRKFYRPNVSVMVHSDYGSICYVRDKALNFRGPIGANCGFILDGHGQVRSSGLQYQCLGHAHSTSNIMLHTHAKFLVQGGAWCFLPLQLGTT